MGKIKFPDLPPGPVRDLKLLLHELHSLAGAPAIRPMAEAVGCSHDTVHKLFTSPYLPANGDLVFRLAGWLAVQGSRPRFAEDDDEGERQFYDLLETKWSDALRYENTAPLPVTPAAPGRRPRRGRTRTTDTASDAPSGHKQSDDPTPNALPQTAVSSGRAYAAQGANVMVIDPEAQRSSSAAVLAALPDPQKSRAVIVAAGRFGSSELPDLPGVLQGAARLAEVLTDPGRPGHIPRPRTDVLINPRSGVAVLDALDRASREAEDTLFLHFSGHGNLTPRGELVLATADSRLESPYTNLAWENVRNLLADSSARRLFIVLDTCFSGRALRGVMGPVDEAFQLGSQAAALPATELFTSTSEFTVAFASDHEPNFTGAFIDLLVSGDPNLRELLTGDEIYRGVSNWARRGDQPRPQRRHTGPGILALGRNPAYHPEEPPSAPRRAKGSTRPEGSPA